MTASAWSPRADVDQLLAFVAVARTGSVGRAADLLARTQPTISARLAGLEAEELRALFLDHPGEVAARVAGLPNPRPTVTSRREEDEP